uniref:Uncharacterized protein n=1 Tax=viral metagenome TaxID=1070528 RepID=A0A6C0JZU3_9ZZZZ
MLNYSREIELGNGYGYFCNIHDVECQKQIVDQTYNNYQKYLEEIEHQEPRRSGCNDTLCSCSLFAFVCTILFFIL